MYRPVLTDRSHLRSRIPHEARRKKRLDSLYRRYNVDRSDPDMTMGEMEEMARLMEMQSEPRVPNLSNEIYIFLEDIKRCMRENYEEQLCRFEPTTPEKWRLKMRGGSEAVTESEYSSDQPTKKKDNPVHVLKLKKIDEGKKAVRFEVGFDPIPERSNEDEDDEPEDDTGILTQFSGFDEIVKRPLDKKPL